MSHHVSNLFKLNNLVKETNLEKVSLPELKEHYIRVKNFQKNHKLLESLPDKGEKYLKRLKNVEEIIARRCADLENNNYSVKRDPAKTEDLGDLLDKFQSILIEKKNAKDEKMEVKTEEVTITIKDEKSGEEPKFEDRVLVKEEKIEAKEPVNYFSRTESKKDKTTIDQLKYKEVKEKVLKNMVSKATKAKSIPIHECFLLLKEHEKRVQVSTIRIKMGYLYAFRNITKKLRFKEFQIQQAANKLLEGKSMAFDYTFSKNTESLSYRDQKSEVGDDDTENDTDSEDEDFFNDYYDDGDNNVDKIDRLHSHETGKQRFKDAL